MLTPFQSTAKASSDSSLSFVLLVQLITQESNLVESVPLQPEFDGLRTNYSATLRNDVSTVLLNAISNTSDASVSVFFEGVQTTFGKLNIGVNVYEVLVLAADKSNTTYRIELTKLRNFIFFLQRCARRTD